LSYRAHIYELEDRNFKVTGVEEERGGITVHHVEVTHTKCNAAGRWQH